MNTATVPLIQSPLYTSPYEGNRKQNFVLPENYNDRHGKITSFKKLKSESRHHFNTLLHYVSQEAAIRDITPTLLKFTCKGAVIKILNYTDVKIKVTTNRMLFLNDFSTTRFTRKNCHNIVYKVSCDSAILCMETKDHDNIPKERTFYVIESKRCYRIPGLSISITKRNNSLWSQIPSQIFDLNDFISKNSTLKTLMKNLPIEADLVANPEAIQFLPRTNFPRFTIINHTKQKIILDIFCHLLINHHFLTKFTKDNCQIIAYHINNNPSLICFEQMDEESVSPAPRVYSLAFKIINKDACINHFLAVHENWAFQRIWVPCTFSQVVIPSDVLRIIVSTYLELLKSDFLNSAA